MLNSQILIDKICCRINQGNLSSLESCQTNGALTILNTPVVSVANVASLPSASSYTGRMIYVDNENRYYYSAAGIWTSDFDSTLEALTTVAYTWGAPTGGRLAGSDVCRSVPTSIVGNITDWRQITTRDNVGNGSSFLGLRSNGTLWAWGYNLFGDLGDNTTANRSSPVSVVGGFTDWCRIDGSLALRTNGTLWTWGCGAYGGLGTNSTANASSPVTVVGGFSDWCAIGGGGPGRAAIRSNGTLWVWGRNTNGQLGDGTTICRSSPVTVVGGFTDWKYVATGEATTAAIRNDGSLWMWGCNLRGQLGDLSTVYRSSPVSVVGGFTDWCQAAMSLSVTLGLRGNGTLWSWGCGPVLGNSLPNTAQSSPVSVVGGFTDWCQVAAVTYHAGAIRSNGSLWTWGCNCNNSLGTAYVFPGRSSPVSVLGGITGWSQVTISRGVNSTTVAGIASTNKGF